MVAQARYLRNLATPHPASAEVQVPDGVIRIYVRAITFGSASDLPVTRLNFMRSPLTLIDEDIQLVPLRSIGLPSADGSPVARRRFIRSDLALVDISMLVEAFVLQDLRPDCMLIEKLCVLSGIPSIGKPKL